MLFAFAVAGLNGCNGEMLALEVGASDIRPWMKIDNVSYMEIQSE